MLKVEIKKGKDKEATLLKINGVEFGEGISSYKITQDDVQRPIMTLSIHCDELNFECDEVEINQEKIK